MCIISANRIYEMGSFPQSSPHVTGKGEKTKHCRSKYKGIKKSKIMKDESIQ